MNGQGCDYLINFGSPRGRLLWEKKFKKLGLKPDPKTHYCQYHLVTTHSPECIMKDPTNPEVGCPVRIAIQAQLLLSEKDS